jgi:multidrug efflux pump subunit AcrA (membrane-fusion protein)
MTYSKISPMYGLGIRDWSDGLTDTPTVTTDRSIAMRSGPTSAQDKLLMVLHQNRDYALVTAPFNGVITQRNVDVGSLVQGDVNTGTFMFEVIQREVIRVFVCVPQGAAFGVAPGVDAIARVPEIPNREFAGKVTRIADALQSGSRTLSIEIDIPNPDDALAPGIFCTVSSRFHARHRPSSFPSKRSSSAATDYRSRW